MTTKTLCALAAVASTSTAMLLSSCTTIGPTSGAAPTAHIAWDYNGIIGTGQSLAVGQNASPAHLTTQPYNNLKLSTGNLPWPIDATNEELKLVPLTEPIGRRGAGGWPLNINGETPHAAMANELTALVKEKFGRDFVSVHTEVGENGRGMDNIKKNPTVRGSNGRAFQATMIEAAAISRLAKADGKTYGIGAITITHGESDAGNGQYETALHQLWQDYNADLPTITGQTNKIIMIVSQQHGIGSHSASTIAQWKVGVDYPDDIVCSGPKYQYPSSDNQGLHLTTVGYEELGEKYAQVYFQRVILGNHWLPLEPTNVTHKGNTLTVQFHVPVAPLNWDTNMDLPHQASTNWQKGRGFEVMSPNNQRITIDSVAIKGNAVIITCANDPGAGARVNYALYPEGQRRMTKPFPGFARWGTLRDSDPFKGTTTGVEQQNYCVAFEMTAP